MGGKSGGTKGMKAVAKVQEKLGVEQAGIAKDYLAFSKQQYAANQGFVKKVLDVQLPAMREQLLAGRQDRARYNKYFAPLETKFAQEAKAYDTPARREAEAGRATADVASAAEQQRENAARQLESFGIDPSMTRAQAIDRQVGVATAANEAMAANQGRIGVEERGRQFEQAAINIGRGYPAQSLAATQGAVNTGTAATGTQMAPQGQMNQGAGVSGNFFSGASNALQGAAGTYQAINTAANQTPWLDTVATIGGMAAGGAAGHMAGGGTPDRKLPVPVGVRTERDTVPALVGRHEFVVPSDVVLRKGTEFLEKMIHKTRAEASGVPLTKPGKAKDSAADPAIPGMQAGPTPDPGARRLVPQTAQEPRQWGAGSLANEPGAAHLAGGGTPDRPLPSPPTDDTAEHRWGIPDRFLPEWLRGGQSPEALAAPEPTTGAMVSQPEALTSMQSSEPDTRPMGLPQRPRELSLRERQSPGPERYPSGTTRDDLYGSGQEPVLDAFGVADSRPETKRIRGMMADAVMASHRSGVAALGLDLRHTYTVPQIDSSGTEGMYLPKQDEILIEQGQAGSVPFHEGIHRGLQKLGDLYPKQFNKIVDQTVKKIGHPIDGEILTRAWLQKVYGPIEKNEDIQKYGQSTWDRAAREGGAGYRQITTAAAEMPQLSAMIDKLDALAARHIAKTRPGGPR